MNLKNRQGATLGSILFFVVLLIIGFIIFKVIKANVDAKSIRSEITQRVGLERGADLTETRVAEIIDEAVSKNGCELTEVNVNFDRKSGKIVLQFSYIQEINFLITKSKKERTEDYSLDAYGY